MAARLQLILVVAPAVVCSLLCYLLHFKVDGCRVQLFGAQRGVRVVDVHGALAFAVEGAVHIKTRLPLDLRTSTGPEHTGGLSWRRKCSDKFRESLTSHTRRNFLTYLDP